MKVLVISDIHANFNALEAVLSAAGRYDAVWCLGDLVGYGPDPDATIERIRSLPNLSCVMGNHDAAVIGKIPLDAFNVEARNSINWNKSKISEKNLQFLNNLPEINVTNQVTLVHGSPRNPVWEYILDTFTAKINFDAFESPICMVGHTHLPVVYYQSRGMFPVKWKLFQKDETYRVQNRVILNPGSVGQPRDHDSRASFAVFDPGENTWEPYRVKYDIVSVQERIHKSGLPWRNALRLAEGW